MRRVGRDINLSLSRERFRFRIRGFCGGLLGLRLCGAFLGRRGRIMIEACLTWVYSLVGFV